MPPPRSTARWGEWPRDRRSASGERGASAPLARLAHDAVVGVEDHVLQLVGGQELRVAIELPEAGLVECGGLAVGLALAGPPRTLPDAGQRLGAVLHAGRGRRLQLGPQRLDLPRPHGLVEEVDDGQWREPLD